jgi:hypothetical protein
LRLVLAEFPGTVRLTEMTPIASPSRIIGTLTRLRSPRARTLARNASE